MINAYASGESSYIDESHGSIASDHSIYREFNCMGGLVWAKYDSPLENPLACASRFRSPPVPVSWMVRVLSRVRNCGCVGLALEPEVADATDESAEDATESDAAEQEAVPATAVRRRYLEHSDRKTVPGVVLPSAQRARTFRVSSSIGVSWSCTCALGTYHHAVPSNAIVHVSGRSKAGLWWLCLQP